MTKAEISIFIEKMEEIGDIWEEEDVERVYKNRSLQEALDDRLGDMNAFASIMNMMVNR